MNDQWPFVVMALSAAAALSFIGFAVGRAVGWSQAVRHLSDKLGGGRP